jgi:hypothetical protein
VYYVASYTIIDHAFMVGSVQVMVFWAVTLCHLLVILTLHCQILTHFFNHGSRLGVLLQNMGVHPQDCTVWEPRRPES